MDKLKPKIVDMFRLHNGEIYNDVETSRRFDPALWERMTKGDRFSFNYSKRLEPDETGFRFPMGVYLLSKEEDLPLSKILGPNVRIVTQRNLLKDLLYQVLPGPKPNSMTIHCERYGTIIFIKQNTKTKRAHPQYIFMDKRRQFFTGDDEPGCIGSTPEKEYRFPDVGKAYAIMSLDHNDSQVLYSCTIHNFSPEGKPVDSTLFQYDGPHQNSSLPYSKLKGMLIKAVSDGFDHHMFFSREGCKVKMNFRNTEKLLQEDPRYHKALRQALDLLMGEQLLSFLSKRRCCKAILKRDPLLHFEPQEVDNEYISFLPKEFERFSRV